MSPMQDSPDLCRIEGAMEQEIHAVFQCLLSIICLCCHGKGYGISIRKVAPQCIQHQSRIRRDVEVNEDAFVLCFCSSSIIPSFPAAVRTSMPSSLHTAVKAVTKNGASRGALELHKVHFILHSTALQGNRDGEGTSLQGRSKQQLCFKYEESHSQR